jgi:formylglycine-generating enzyme required for sulfatase activity
MMRKAAIVHGWRSLVVATVLIAAGLVGWRIRHAVVQAKNITRSQGLVASLLNAEITQVPTIVSEMRELREWADPLLKARVADAEDGSAEKLHLSLALLPDDASQLDYLSRQLPVCKLDQFPVVRDALLPRHEKVSPALWQLVQHEQQDPDVRFQASAALAQYAPDDERWEEIAPFVAEHLTNAVSSVYFGQWLEQFQSVRRQLSNPLIAIHAQRSRSLKQRETAALALAAYLRDQPDKLVDVILVADEFTEFWPLVAALRPYSAAVRQPLIAELMAPIPGQLAKFDDHFSEEEQLQRDALWKRRALAAVAIVQLGAGNDVWPRLELTPDPSLRSFIIYHFGKLRADHHTLAVRLESESNVSIRRALIQSLGGLEATVIPPADRNRIAGQLKALYVNDPDPGIHASASWTLRQWGQTLPELPVGEPPMAKTQTRRWYVNGQGQTMLIFPNSSEDGQSQLKHDFTISSHEVTVGEYRRFQQQHVLDWTVTPSEDCPVHNVNWYMAAEYCNWLSQQEGSPEDQWVYAPDNGGKYAEGMKIKENYRELSGYRLPTDAEWDHACRAGTTGTYAFGEPITLLRRYGWYVLNASGRSHPVESLLPNDAGLFDTYGNVREWTQNPTSGPVSPVRDDSNRVLCGGSFVNQASLVHSANRGTPLPTNRSNYNGFRVARSLPHGSSR